MTKVFGVIMAGGVGTRFWPRSREKTPKQALEITGKETMIQSTAGRLTRMIDPRNLFIITNRMQRALLAKQLLVRSRRQYPGRTGRAEHRAVHRSRGAPLPPRRSRRGHDRAARRPCHPERRGVPPYPRRCRRDRPMNPRSLLTIGIQAPPPGDRVRVHPDLHGSRGRTTRMHHAG